MFRVVFLVFLASAHAQVILPGTCGNETTGIPLLNLTALATWQEVQRTPNLLELGQCSTVSLQQRPNTTQPLVLSIREVVNKTARYHNGTVTTYSTGRVTVNFTGVVLDLGVLKTDSKNYALVYGCRNIANNTKEVYGWKLSRNSTLSSSDVSSIDAAVNGTDLRNMTWSIISHSTEACKVNAAVTSQVSIVLGVLALVVAMKN